MTIRTSGFRASARLGLLALSLAALVGASGGAEARDIIAGSVIRVGGGPGFAGFHGHYSRVAGFRNGRHFAFTQVGYGRAAYGLGVAGPAGLGIAGSTIGLGVGRVGVGHGNPYAGYYGYPYGD